MPYDTCYAEDRGRSNEANGQQSEQKEGEMGAVAGVKEKL